MFQQRADFDAIYVLLCMHQANAFKVERTRILLVGYGYLAKEDRSSDVVSSHFALSRRPAQLAQWRRQRGETR